MLQNPSSIHLHSWMQMRPAAAATTPAITWCTQIACQCTVVVSVIHVHASPPGDDPSLPAATQEPDPKQLLAVWLFIHPDALDAFEAWLKGLHEDNTFLTAGAANLHLSLQHMEDAEKALPGKVIRLEQRAGDQVYVPPGWPHFVTNAATTVKLAFDTVHTRQLPQYITAHHRVNARMSRSATDYIEIAKLLPCLCDAQLSTAFPINIQLPAK
jgi:hypothetical protein